MLRWQFMRKKALVVTLCWTLPLFGWGVEGHDLIARIAEAQLTPAVHAKVAEILGPNVSMASVASWADQVRRDRAESGPWHYIDIPINKPHLDMRRDCPKGDCVIKKIEDFETVLHDPNTPPVQRREALMFLIHFVGDMHQPLHDSDNADKGGNDVHVIYQGRPTNLHSLWDSGLLGNMGKEDELFPVYSADSARHAKKWAKGSVEKWSDESHKEAVKITYGLLPKATDKTTPVTITPEYEVKADPLIRLQIEKAGARLARVLNQTLQ
jgi:S1/P1 Nuclease